MLKKRCGGNEGKGSTGFKSRRAMKGEEDEREIRYRGGREELYREGRERETKETMNNEAALENNIDKLNWNMSVRTYTI